MIIYNEDPQYGKFTEEEKKKLEEVLGNFKNIQFILTKYGDGIGVSLCMPSFDMFITNDLLADNLWNFKILKRSLARWFTRNLKEEIKEFIEDFNYGYIVSTTKEEE